jgi:hypothetical protein
MGTGGLDLWAATERAESGNHATVANTNDTVNRRIRVDACFQAIIGRAPIGRSNPTDRGNQADNDPRAST